MNRSRFLVGLLCGFLGAAAGYFLAVRMCLGIPTASTYHPNVFLVAKRKIAQGIPRPKIIFVGGSNVDYGISARLVQETTGVPAVNLGLWQPLGPEYILEQVKQVAHPGDLVVLTFEYGLYDWVGDCQYWTHSQFMPVIYSRDPHFVQTRGADEQFQMAIRLEGTFFLDCLEAKLHLGSVPKPPEGDFYQTHDGWGDNISNSTPDHRPINKLIYTTHDEIFDWKSAMENPRSLPYLADFVRWGRASGVNVIATFPNMVADSCTCSPQARTVEEKVGQLYESLHVPVLGTPQDTLLPPELFYNSYYHLQSDAVHDRTLQLIPKLLPFLPSK